MRAFLILYSAVCGGACGSRFCRRPARPLTCLMLGLLLQHVLVCPAAADECYSDKGERRLRQVLSFEDDGSLVLDGNERVFLAGVKLPGQGRRGAGGYNCLNESLDYLRARTGGMSVFVVYAGSGRDASYRRPVYMFEPGGGFLNLELVRYGFAAAADTMPGSSEQIGCGDELADAERGARSKNIAGWKAGCLKDEEETSGGGEPAVIITDF